MKLKKIEHQNGYKFFLTFVNGEKINVDLEELISSYVKPQETDTARIDVDWGCLEFNNGKVDLEPKTLYRYAKDHSQKLH